PDEPRFATSLFRMTWRVCAMVLSPSSFPSRARDGEREESDVARALDRERDLALVQRAVAADAARGDLATLGDEVLHRLRVLVINDRCLIRAELADALFATATAARSVSVQVRRSAEILIVIH